MTQDELTELRQMARENSKLIPIMSKPVLRELLALRDAALAAYPGRTVEQIIAGWTASGDAP